MTIWIPASLAGWWPIDFASDFAPVPVPAISTHSWSFPQPFPHIVHHFYQPQEIIWWSDKLWRAASTGFEDYPAMSWIFGWNQLQLDGRSQLLNPYTEILLHNVYDIWSLNRISNFYWLPESSSPSSPSLTDWCPGPTTSAGCASETRCRVRHLANHLSSCHQVSWLHGVLIRFRGMVQMIQMFLSYVFLNIFLISSNKLTMILISIAVGSPCIRSRLQRPLDSYQVS